MRKTARVTLLVGWLILAPSLLAHFWLAYPEAGPRVPLSLAERLIDLYGSRDGEDLADLEDLFALAVSFLLVATLTALVWLGWRRHSADRASR